MISAALPYKDYLLFFEREKECQAKVAAPFESLAPLELREYSSILDYTNDSYYGILRDMAGVAKR